MDLGNTNATMGLFESGRLLHTYRVQTRRGSTTDECGVLLRQLLALRGVPKSALDGAIVASVVPSLTAPLVEAIRLYFGCEVRVVGADLPLGVSVECDHPEEVGADRLVNVVAARQQLSAMGRSSCGAIVVDFGTATTLDCVSPTGAYLGGVIAPGVSVGLDGLLARAARLHSVSLTAPASVVGRNTVHALQSGLVYGHAAMVEGLVARLRRELAFECCVLATGGLAPAIAQLAPCIEKVEEHLTLAGLLHIDAKLSAPPP